MSTNPRVAVPTATIIALAVSALALVALTRDDARPRHDPLAAPVEAAHADDVAADLVHVRRPIAHEAVAAPTAAAQPTTAPLFPATREAWDAWCIEADIDPVAWSRADVRDAWAVTQQRREVTYALASYQDRELARWTAREASVPLEAELDVEALALLTPDPARLRGMIAAHSIATAILVQRAGEATDSLDTPDTLWPLIAELDTVSTFRSAAKLLESLR